MVRATVIVLVLLYAGMEPAYSQIFNLGEPKDRGEPIFSPLKNFRERAATGAPAVLAEKAKEACASCKLKGKLFPEAACKRCEAKKKKEAEEADEKEKDEKTKEAELKKLEAEAKKAELEVKQLEEEDKKRNKPWDVADKENAELGDLLAAAAAAKKEQDLAPKKQQALDYLASLGCNKDPNVTKALLAGLQDFNVEVRMTAVQAVIYSVQGPDALQYPADPFYAEPFVGGEFGMSPVQTGCTACAAQSCQQCGPSGPKNEDCPACDIAEKRKLAKENRKAQRVQRRSSQCNCGSASNACGCGNVVYGAVTEGCGCDTGAFPEGHDGCISCCAKVIRAELKKMAFDPDPTRANCYYEPSIEVRNLALQAYNLCPEQKEEPDEDPDAVLDNGSAEGEGGDSEEGSSEGSGDDDMLDLLPEDSNNPPEPDNEDSGELESSEEKKESEDEAAGGDADKESEDEATDGEALLISPGVSNEIGYSDSKMLRGRVSRFLNDGYEIQYSKQFEIPTGNLLYIATGASSDAHVVEVVASSPGNAVVKVVEGRFAGRTSSIQIGVMR